MVLFLLLKERGINFTLVKTRQSSFAVNWWCGGTCPNAYLTLRRGHKWGARLWRTTFSLLANEKWQDLLLRMVVGGPLQGKGTCLTVSISLIKDGRWWSVTRQGNMSDRIYLSSLSFCLICPSPECINSLCVFYNVFVLFFFLFCFHVKTLEIVLVFYCQLYIKYLTIMKWNHVLWK